MPKFEAVSADGQRGLFDPVEALSKAAQTGVKITHYDPATRNISVEFDTQFNELPDAIRSKTGTINIDEYAKGLGVTAGKLSGAFNDASTPVENSPVDMATRARVGLARSASGEAKEAIAATLSMMGEVPYSAEASDIATAKQQARALSVLKKQFDDAQVKNGEIVVKRDGIWYKANAPGADRGDVAEWLGQNGIGALFGLMAAGGATAATGGNVAAGAAAAGAVQVLAVGAKEALSHAIEGDAVDPHLVAQDMLVEGLFGAGAAKAVSGGSKFLPAAIEQGARLAGVQSLAGHTQFIRPAIYSGGKAISQGMANFAKNAAPEVKDAVSKIISSYGANVSQPTLRAVIESDDSLREALKYGKAFHASKPGEAAVAKQMVETLQAGLSSADDAASANFGVFINALKAKAKASPDDFVLDVGNLNRQLRALVGDDDSAAKSLLRDVFSRLSGAVERHTPSDPLSGLGNAPGKIVANGAAAIDELMAIKDAAKHALKRTGAFRGGGHLVVVDSSSERAINGIFSIIQSELDKAAGTLGMADDLAKANTNYGEAMRALTTVSGRVFSEKAAGKNAALVARDGLVDANTGANDVKNALTMLEAVPGTADVANTLSKSLNKLRIIQGGIEVTPWVAPPSGFLRSAAVGGGFAAAVAKGAAALNPVTGLLATVAAPIVSPRAGLAYSVGAAKAAGALGTTVGKAAGLAGKAEVVATGLVRMATSLGPLRTLSQAQMNALIANPEKFLGYVKEVNAFVEASPEATKAHISKKAVEKANGK